MKRGKKIVSLLLTMLLFIQCSAISYAKEPDSLPQEAVYDLQKGGTQTFEIVESDGNKAIVTISEEKAVSRIANGSYNVKYTSVGCWTAGFKVSISNNNFTSAYSPYVNIITGSVSHRTLKLETSKKASFYFRYMIALRETTTGVRATMSGTTLKVSKI